MSILYSGKHIDIEHLPEKYQIQDLPPIEKTQESNSGVQPDERFALHQGVFTTDTAQLDWDSGEVDFKELINDFESQLIIKAMKISGGNKKEAAKILNLKRTTLLEKIKKKNLSGSWE